MSSCGRGRVPVIAPMIRGGVGAAPSRYNRPAPSGEDIGRWLATQRRDFRHLNAEQQRRLTELGVKPARVVPARPGPGRRPRSPTTSTRRGSLPQGPPSPPAVPGAGRQRHTGAFARRAASGRKRTPYRGVAGEPEAATRPTHPGAARSPRRPRTVVGRLVTGPPRPVGALRTRLGRTLPAIYSCSDLNRAIAVPL